MQYIPFEIFQPERNERQDELQSLKSGESRRRRLLTRIYCFPTLFLFASVFPSHFFFAFNVSWKVICVRAHTSCVQWETKNILSSWERKWWKAKKSVPFRWVSPPLTHTKKNKLTWTREGRRRRKSLPTIHHGVVTSARVSISFSSRSDNGERDQKIFLGPRVLPWAPI